jgi:hypothetical protein
MAIVTTAAGRQTTPADADRPEIGGMSLSTPSSDLEAALRERGSAAYVITTGDGARPHVVLAEVTRQGSGFVAEVGKRTAANARRQPHVSLLFPARDPSDYSLIVDAVATVEEPDRLRFAPTRAVLHRPAPGSGPAVSSCGSDCVPLSLEGSS